MSDLQVDNEQPFSGLTPDTVLQAVESRGYMTSGHVMGLNSYENRVFQVGIDDAEPVIVKFYRPHRWNDLQIIEEHEFCFELLDNEVSVVAPLRDMDGNTLSVFNGMRFAVFPRRGGRALELDNPDHLYAMGQHLGRMHATGKVKPFRYRPALDVHEFGEQSASFLLENFLPEGLKVAYSSLAKDLLEKIRKAFAKADSLQWIRCHGDCHPGNVLWRDEMPHFVDFDDARMAPAIQDIWMLLSGDRQQQTLQLSEVIEGYNMFNEFEPAEIALIEPLRTLRMMHYAAWLARRWNDPAFPLHFPWFNTERYWGEHILQLREQLYALEQPSLELL